MLSDSRAIRRRRRRIGRRTGKRHRLIYTRTTARSSDFPENHTSFARYLDRAAVDSAAARPLDVNVSPTRTIVALKHAE